MKTLKIQSLLVFILILSSNNLFAQEDYEDVVYLKNGSIIHGMIIEQIPGVSIKIQTADRNVFFFKIEEIEKITKELKPSDGKQKKPKKKYPPKGIVVQASFILLGASAEVNYLIYPVSIGIGTGVNKIYGGRSHVPFYFDSKLYFTKTRFSPLLALEFGGSYIGGGYFGFHINPYTGFRLMLSNNLAINFGIGVSWERDRWYSTYSRITYDELAAIPVLKLGLSYRFGK